MIRSLAIVVILTPSITLPALAADLPGDSQSFACLPKGAVSSLLPAQGYSDVKQLREQKGITYFDARTGDGWFRIGIDRCSAQVTSRQRETAPR